MTSILREEISVILMQGVCDKSSSAYHSSSSSNESVRGGLRKERTSVQVLFLTGSGEAPFYEL
ncbi:hypothetical protein, partial [Syntrophaceticus schinkii]|uniref:hypothetical protein n=1 Tax=Syntrophaceticus schinkii TaxID=499207 RepID=UPI001E3445AB